MIRRLLAAAALAVVLTGCNGPVVICTTGDNGFYGCQWFPATYDTP